jgi:N-acylglucosamine 2-epimerase
MMSAPPAADDQLRALRATWEGDLFESVMPFWMTHSIDEEHGGFFTCLDNDGSCYDETKYAWLQGRQVYTLSRLYNEVRPSSEGGGGAVGATHGVTAETRAAWLRGAAAGARFLDCAKDEAGLLFFSTSRDGRSRLHLQRKPYSAVFYVLGLLEFWKALRTHAAEGGGVLTEEEHGVTLGPDEAAVDAAYLGKSMAMFDELARWIDDPSLCGRPAPNVPPGDAAAAGDPGETRLADVMCMASLALDFLRHLAGTPQDTAARREQYLGLIRAAMANCERHYDTRGPGGGRKVFLETCSGAGLSSATPAGRMFNPGHSIEVAWFLLLMCDAVPGGSARHEELALAVLQGSLEAGWDDAAHGGGLLYMMDIEGRPLLDATVTADGKLWWPHTEALIALTMAYTRTRDPKWMAWLQRVHDYAYRHFVRREDGVENVGGEWWGYCRRDGSLARSAKGGNYKGCFHVPRALLMCAQIAAQHLDKQ